MSFIPQKADKYIFCICLNQPPYGGFFKSYAEKVHIRFSHYHLNKQKYPIVSIKTASSTATAHSGSTIPATIPTQKVKAANPTALQPSIITATTPFRKPPFRYHVRLIKNFIFYSMLTKKNCENCKNT